MESDDTVYGECRCCLTNAHLKNMWEQYENGNCEREIYGKMLMDCFSISWIIQERVEDDKICFTCIDKLQNAISFKKQVKECQEKLKQRSLEQVEESENSDEEQSYVIAKKFIAEMNPLTHSYKKKSLQLQKMQRINTIQSEEENMSQDEDTSTHSYNNQSIKMEKEDGNQSENETGFQNLEFLEDDMVEASENVKPLVKEESEPEKKKPKVSHTNENTDENRNSPSSVHATNDNQLQVTEEVTEGYEAILGRHKDNIRSILIASNATPIRGFWGDKFVCYYCSEKFSSPKELKQHTYCHEDTPFKYKVKSLAEHVVKLDVTHLKCNICNIAIDSLSSLMVHLRDIHEMLIHFDIPNHIVPYNFELDDLKCALCPEQFDDFKSLSDHMNDVHCRNYVCRECNQGFVNIRSLKTHSIRHGIGILACMQCANVFNDRSKLSQHESICHRKDNTVLRSESVDNKCVECGERFDLKQDLKNHIVVKHFGLGKRTIHKCPHCPRLYSKLSILTEHIKLHDSNN